jgi:adenine-specific DNA-methyltransferase
VGETEERKAATEGAALNDQSVARNGNKGRLELTWTNKDRALLSREDGSYEWVPKRDHRVAEVRLLRDAGTVGEIHDDADRSKDNLLIRGDALNALTTLTRSPEFAEEYAGKVKLAYIDPPFNTGQAFEHYDDGLEHSVWLTMMRDRLMQIKELLSPDGSVWVHCDDAEQHRVRSVLDEVFGSGSFRSTIVWQKLYARKSNTEFSGTHDYIHVYAREPESFRRNKLPPSEDQLARYKNPDNDRRGPWQSVSFHVRTDNPEKRREYRYEIELPSGRRVLPPKGRHWNGKRPRFEALVSEGRIWFGKGDSLPRYKDFIDLDDIGLVPMSWWPRQEVGDNDESKEELMGLFPEIQDVFQTPKPERLIERIIHIGSEPGDIVLDCFAGSGTTAAVAHKMGRRWVTSEWREETIDTFTAPRLEKVVNGEDPGGITEAVEWQGGGGFRVLDVAPSIFEDDDGVVVLADWVTDHELGQAVAAQLGFEYEPEQPFCGRQGKLRLTVVDGHVDKAAVKLLVQSLGEGEKLSLCATSLDPDAGAALKKLSRGSQARVVPQDILLSYRTPSTWQASVSKKEEG